MREVRGVKSCLDEEIRGREIISENWMNKKKKEKRKKITSQDK